MQIGKQRVWNPQVRKQNLKTSLYRCNDSQSLAKIHVCFKQQLSGLVEAAATGEHAFACLLCKLVLVLPVTNQSQTIVFEKHLHKQHL